MSSKEKINYLLEEVKRLETLLLSVQDAEIYPVSFFNQSFDLTRELLKELYQLETDQVDMLRQQMEARQALLRESLLLTSVEQVREEEAQKPVIAVTEEEETIKEELEEVVVEVKEEEFIIQGPFTTEPAPPVEEETPQTEEPDPVVEAVIEETPVKEEKSIEELLKEYASPQPLIPEKVQERTTACLGDLIEKKNLADFTKAFSLNDRFYFLRELFEGDANRMNEVISDLNQIESLDESLDYLNNKLRWNPEDTPVADFIRLLEKRFL